MQLFLAAGPVGATSVRDTYKASIDGARLRPHQAPSSNANAEHAALAGDGRELVTTDTGRYRRNVGSRFGCEWAAIGAARLATGEGCDGRRAVN